MRMQEEIIRVKQGGSLLKIGSCNIHIVHSAFKNGMVVSKWHVDSFYLDLYSWFKCSATRQEDFKNVLEEIDSLLEKTILYFAITRWVLMGKVVNRLLSMCIFSFHYPTFLSLFRSMGSFM
jgi:hypothetical protein